MESLTEKLMNNSLAIGIVVVVVTVFVTVLRMVFIPRWQSSNKIRAEKEMEEARIEVERKRHELQHLKDMDEAALQQARSAAVLTDKTAEAVATVESMSKSLGQKITGLVEDVNTLLEQNETNPCQSGQIAQIRIALIHTCELAVEKGWLNRQDIQKITTALNHRDK